MTHSQTYYRIRTAVRVLAATLAATALMVIASLDSQTLL